MRIKQIARLSTCALGIAALGACDILDVENPNNLVEESIENPAAASAVVNGSLSLVSQSISSIWEPYLVASDEFYWIGSRDAWFALDQGFVSDEFNEFTDAAFPTLGEARWMSNRAVEILEGHVANSEGDFTRDLARANLYAGMIHMIIAEVQEDFAFSDKTEDGPPVGPSNMVTVFDQAIAYLDDAVAGAASAGDAELETRALAIRARAKHSKALWGKIKPTPNTASPLVSSSGASADAAAVVARVGVTTDWTYDLQYSSATVSNSMAGNVNQRRENAIDPAYATNNSADGKPFEITGSAITDPIDGGQDPVVIAKLNKWKGGDYTNTGDQFAPLTVADARLMHLILAEDALAGGDTGGFTTHINHIRAMDGATPYSGQIPAMDMLKHTRRVNTMIMGLRLFDMYRFGIQDPKWQSGSAAVSSPGSLLPITIIEIRANCYLNGSC